MPTVIEKDIRSSSDPLNSFPWCDFTFDPVTLSVTINDFNGLRDAVKDAALKGTRAFTLKAGKLTTPHTLIVTNAGVLSFVPIDEQPATCYAHLAFYDPITQTLTKLKFVEMGII